MGEPQKIYLKNYVKPAYTTKTTDIFINIFEDYTVVKTKLSIDKTRAGDEPLILYGVDLELKSFVLNGKGTTNYKIEDETLTISGLQDKNIIETEVIIHPEKNLTLEGLYKSGGIYCTQNEPQGFRKITYFQDEPDVLSIFTTTIEAAKEYKYLLSNGNKIDEKDLPHGRHMATWHDPHPKPSYLYAVVAGDLAKISDSFITMSGKRVALELFVDHGNEDKTEHAMASLKHAMKWDEERFGREYDLDIFMTVAVDSFNMGAMENKGLNIFNSSCILANKETATDDNFQRIEGVVGHEYFHNWSGNRVTLRDWFQLTLKEGLTVFRDQEFSSDMLSRPVKRIDDVKVLRAHQFAEDNGPLKHPIKPKSYIEVNNFYTPTVYEKGAEVIRMLHTILGETNFRKGTDLYFKTYDGQAVTTEDFVNALSSASSVDLAQFKLWYNQVGTPKVIVKEEYSKDKNEYSLTLEQEANFDDGSHEPLLIPLKFALLNSKGEEIKNEFGDLILFNKMQDTFVFKGINERPILSINRNFSAPIHLEKKTTLKDLAFLLKFDSDHFNKYDAAESLYYQELSSLKKGDDVEPEFFEAYDALLSHSKEDPSFSSYILALPSLLEMNEAEEKPSYEQNYIVREKLKSLIGNKFSKEFLEIYNSLNLEKKFDVSSESMGKRALKNLALSYLSYSDAHEVRDLIFKQFEDATNMTDELSALKILVHSQHEKASHALSSFYKKWKHETLVIQKWFALQASEKDANVIKTMEHMMTLPEYDKKIPNIVRSVVHQFAMNNPVMFNAEDGSGYEFVARVIKDVDSYNPQLASRLAKTMGHMKKLDNKRQEKLKSVLNSLLTQDLSRDTYEVVHSNLNG